MIHVITGNGRAANEKGSARENSKGSLKDLCFKEKQKTEYFSKNESGQALIQIIKQTHSSSIPLRMRGKRIKT